MKDRFQFKGRITMLSEDYETERDATPEEFSEALDLLARKLSVATASGTGATGECDFVFDEAGSV